jgi:CRISPR-associated protein Cmr6
LPGRAGARAPTASAIPRPGDLVRALLLTEKTRRGGWKAQHEATGLVGEIQNTEEVPADKRPGDAVTLKVMAVHTRGMAFRWPGPGAEGQAPTGRRRSGGPRPGG